MSDKVVVNFVVFVPLLILLSSCQGEIPKENKAYSTGILIDIKHHSGREWYTFKFYGNEKVRKTTKPSYLDYFQLGECYNLYYDKQDLDRTEVYFDRPIIKDKMDYQFVKGRVEEINTRFGDTREYISVEFSYAIDQKKYRREQYTHILSLRESDYIEVMYQVENPAIGYLVKNLETGESESFF